MNESFHDKDDDDLDLDDDDDDDDDNDDDDDGFFAFGVQKIINNIASLLSLHAFL